MRPDDSGLESYLQRLLSESTRVASQEGWRTAQSPGGPPLFNYREDHVGMVVALAKKIAADSGADQRIVTLAAWLHDISKPDIGGPEDHGRESAERAREILASQGVSPHDIDRICKTIEAHVGLTLNGPLASPEAQALWEADKIVKLGVSGFIHYLVNALRLRPGMSTEDLARELRDFLPLAHRIASSMHTKAGRMMANQRLGHILELSRMLDAELEQVR